MNGGTRIPLQFRREALSIAESLRDEIPWTPCGNEVCESILKRSGRLAELVIEADLATQQPYVPPPCSLCGGVGAVPGFWLGTTKTCPSCHGKGVQ